MTLQDVGKLLVATGALLLIAGVLVLLGARMGLGNLPGDFSWRKGNVAVYFPLVSSIVLSILLTVVLNVVSRFFR